MTNNQPFRPSTGSMIMGGLIVAGFLILGYFVLKGLYSLLSFAAPVLVIAALIIRPSVVRGFLNGLWNRVRQNWLIGIILVLLCAVFFPFVSLYLLLRALLVRKVDEMTEGAVTRRQQEEQLTEYEDISDEIFDQGELDRMLIELERKEKREG